MQIARHHKSRGTEWILISLKPYHGIRYIDLISNYDGGSRHVSYGNANVFRTKIDLRLLNYFIKKMKRV